MEARIADNVHKNLNKENKLNNCASLPNKKKNRNLPKKVLNQSIAKDIQITKNNLNTEPTDNKESLECVFPPKKLTRRQKEKRKKAVFKGLENQEAVEKLNTALDSLNIDNNKEVSSKSKDNKTEKTKDKKMKVKKPQNGEETMNNGVVRGLNVQVQNNMYTRSRNKKPPETKNAAITKVNGRTRAIEAMNKPVEIDRAVKIMKQMGWTGGSLGVRGDGITEPIMPALDLVNRAGFGHVKESKLPPPIKMPQVPIPDPNAINAANNNNFHFGQNCGVQPVPLLAINFSQIPADVAHLISKKDLNAINKIYKREKVLKARNPSDFRINFLTKFLDLISTDITKITIKYNPELTRKETSFCKSAVSVLNARSKVTLHYEEKDLVDEISRILNDNLDISVRCCFIHKNELELTKTIKTKKFKDLFTQAKCLNRNDININYTEALPNLDQLLSLAPKVTTQKAFDSIKFRVELLLKILLFLKTEDVFMEIVYDKQVPVKQQNFILTMVDNVNRRKKCGSNNCEMYLSFELIKRLGVWVLNIQFGNDLRTITLTKENRLAISKNLIDFKPGTKDDEKMDVEHFNETIIIDDDDVDYGLDVTEAREGSEVQNNGFIVNCMDYKKNSCNSANGVKEESQVQNIPFINNMDYKNSYNSYAFGVIEGSKVQNIPIINNIDVKNNYNSYAFDVTKALEGIEVQNNVPIINNTEINSYNTVVSNVQNESQTNEIQAKDDSHKGDNVKRVGEKVNNNSQEEKTVIKNASLVSDIIDEIIDKGDITQHKKEAIKEKDVIKDNVEENSIEPIILKTSDNEKSVIDNEIVNGNIELPIDTKDKKTESECESEIENIKIKTKPTDLDDSIVILVPNNYPKDEIDVKKVIEIQLTISSNISHTKELPLLKCHGVQNGALIYTCHSKKSFSFIKKIISVVNDIKISTIKVDTLSLKFKAFFDFNISYIFNKLEIYNLGICTKNWEVIETEISEECVTLVTKMDDESIKYILNSNLSLYAGIDKVDFSIYLS